MNKAAFLDRDGTINIDKNYLYKIEDFEFIPGAIETMRKLKELGYLLVIITNQSGIARGYYTEEDFYTLTEWMKEVLLNKGISIDGVYYCPHLPDAEMKKYKVECNCRKPKTGLFYKAAMELNIDIDNSIAIGDKMRDLAICDETMCRGFLIDKIGDEIKDNSSIERVDSIVSIIDVI